jgi:Fur family zinc uptake transcriptional regulator
MPLNRNRPQVTCRHPDGDLVWWPQRTGEIRVPEDCGRIGSVDAAEALCRARGRRFTQQRRAVLEKLLQTGRPVTAYELLDLVRPDDPAMTSASIYRSLEFLIGMGLVHRLDSTRSFVACDHPDHPHAGHFLICRECGTVVEADDRRIAQATESLGERHGFKLDHRTVELTGVCGACRNDATAKMAGNQP